MRNLRASPKVQSDLESIWLCIARESGSAEAATRVIDNITHRFVLLARYPYIGRQREDLRPGLRSFVAGDYVIIYRVEEPDTVLILHIFQGRHDIGGLLE
ncbi:MAG TPA: type II toxin-antitoxin system RelE/ParE family toxin [Candidatus Binatia bacterium]|nr:type II toxin-antitoxin system RelE/ParE family toxin [Candidatus Binatia bacterium]